MNEIAHRINLIQILMKNQLKVECVTGVCAIMFEVLSEQGKAKESLEM